MATVGAAPEGALPELASVWWRPRVDERRLRGTGRLWTLITFAHTVPFVIAAVALSVLKPVTIPIALVLLAHAWVIPELYAVRGAGVVKARRRKHEEHAEKVAMGLLGDLLDHRARSLRERSGLALERGSLGVWLVGEAGALLIRLGGRRALCYCVGVNDAGLPPSDRTAHLLLALRQDEAGFATVANLAFAGAPWRLRRRLPAHQREALDVAVDEARAVRSSAV